jgi:hypothetical protein
MAAKLNCIARPDEAFAPGPQAAGTSSARAASSSRRTPIHYGQETARTPSCSTTRTGSRAASRGKGIQSPQESEESDAQHEVIGMSQMFDAPRGTQTQGESSQVTKLSLNLFGKAIR